jgi:hypothetical protein
VIPDIQRWLRKDREAVPIGPIGPIGQRSASSATAALIVVLAVVFLAFHLPYLPSSLEDLDSVNFALGIHQFDVARHQPHPPGYPVFILVARNARAFMGSDARALAAVSVVGGAIGVLAVAALFRRLSEGDWGRWTIAATTLAVTCPLYWFTSARPLSDAAGLAAAVAVQAMILAATTDAGLAAAAFIAGLAVGLRSQVLWLTAPLLVWGPASTRRRIVAAAAAFGAGVLVWLAPLVALAGGPAAYWRAVSNQGAEDLGGVRMLWTTPTPRTFVDALYFAGVAPWATWPTAAIVLVLASLGVVALWRTKPRAVSVLALAFGPYFLFDLFFQETVTSRYALPLVIPVAFLAAAGLRLLPQPAAVLAATGLVMFHAHVGGRSVASYSRDDAPAFKLLEDMRADTGLSVIKPVFAPDRRQRFDLQRPIAWLGDAGPHFDRQLASPPQHEWLEAVSYWNAGGRAPLWLVVDPRRAAIELVQHDDPRKYRWTIPHPVLLSGTRPSEADWYRLDRPDWYVGQGWALTPESAGVAGADHRGLEYGPIDAWVRGAALGRSGVLLIGGRNFDPVKQPTLSIAVGAIWSTALQVRPGAFLELIPIPRHDPGEGPRSDLVSSAPDYIKLTVSTNPAARVAIEQFDASSSRSMVGFGQGWFEPEYDPSTGRRWRWLSERGELHYVTRGDSLVMLHLEGESPRKYYRQGSRIVVRAGGRVLREVTVADDFSLDVPVPAAFMSETIIVETDQTHVPAQKLWPRSPDQRRLGLRIFRCQLRALTPASAPGTAASSPQAR